LLSTRCDSEPIFNPRQGHNFDSTVTDDAAADFMPAGGQRVSRPLAFSHLGAESARADLRELDRLEAAAGNVRGLSPGDKRSRLPDALDALLRAPAPPPKALAPRLNIAP
ncbi:MAG TPA: hypothetical protein VMB73_16025, partial [Acetobacteraceae bacterium]|nr:hypothetical protein [Acetobacteraceae bacterium]